MAALLEVRNLSVRYGKVEAVPDVSILFSFTRSYFHVDLERVSDAV